VDWSTSISHFPCMGQFLREGYQYCNCVHFAQSIMANITCHLAVKMWWWCSMELLVRFHTFPHLKLSFPQITLLLMHSWGILWHDSFTGVHTHEHEHFLKHSLIE
jgi:hypothetical protein